MTDLCKHKGAAASINWFVSLLSGKARSDQKETIKVLTDMLNQMREHNCAKCSTRKDCHELDKAMKAVSESDRTPAFVSEPAAVGPLIMRRDHARRSRLIRPSGR
ncbi:MAG: hypothetical protein WCJ64_22135 [Rhodospirillaceae bacterium]